MAIVSTFARRLLVSKVSAFVLVAKGLEMFLIAHLTHHIRIIGIITINQYTYIFMN